MKTCLLGVDIGTSSYKTALFDAGGKALARSGSDYPVAYPRRGWAEQAPDQWWSGVCRAIRDMMGESGVSPADIAGIGVDGQSWSAITLDGQGNVLCPTPIWTDTRCGVICRDV